MRGLIYRSILLTIQIDLQAIFKCNFHHIFWGPIDGPRTATDDSDWRGTNLYCYPVCPKVSSLGQFFKICSGASSKRQTLIHRKASVHIVCTSVVFLKFLLLISGTFATDHDLDQSKQLFSG